MFVHTRDSNSDLRSIRTVLQLNQVLNDFIWIDGYHHITLSCNGLVLV